MHTYDIDGHLQVDVRLLAGSLRFVETPPGRATVELRANGPGGQALIDDARVELADAGGPPRLLVHVPRGKARGRVFIGLRDGTVDVTIGCPPGSDVVVRVASAEITSEVELGDARIDTASGAVGLFRVGGDLAVSSASGDVEVAAVDGDATVKTASGDVATGEVGGELTVRSASGDVTTGAVAGDINVRSVSGDIDVAQAAGRRVSANSTSGDVQLAIAPGRSVHLDVATVSGALTSDLDEGDGTGGVDLELRARTVSGDVHLRRSRAARTPPG